MNNNRFNNQEIALFWSSLSVDDKGQVFRQNKNGFTYYKDYKYIRQNEQNYLLEQSTGKLFDNNLNYYYQGKYYDFNGNFISNSKNDNIIDVDKIDTQYKINKPDEKVEIFDYDGNSLGYRDIPKKKKYKSIKGPKLKEKISELYNMNKNIRQELLELVSQTGSHAINEADSKIASFLNGEISLSQEELESIKNEFIDKWFNTAPSKRKLKEYESYSLKEYFDLPDDEYDDYIAEKLLDKVSNRKDLTETLDITKDEQLHFDKQWKKDDIFKFSNGTSETRAKLFLSEGKGYTSLQTPAFVEGETYLSRTGLQISMQGTDFELRSPEYAKAQSNRFKDRPVIIEGEIPAQYVYANQTRGGEFGIPHQYYDKISSAKILDAETRQELYHLENGKLIKSDSFTEAKLPELKIKEEHTTKKKKYKPVKGPKLKNNNIKTEIPKSKPKYKPVKGPKLKEVTKQDKNLEKATNEVFDNFTENINNTPKSKVKSTPKPSKNIVKPAKNASKMTTKSLGGTGKGAIGLIVVGIAGLAIGKALSSDDNNKDKEQDKQVAKQQNISYNNQYIDNQYAMQMAQDISSYRYGKHMTGFVNY